MTNGRGVYEIGPALCAAAYSQGKQLAVVEIIPKRNYKRDQLSL